MKLFYHIIDDLLVNAHGLLLKVLESA